MSSKIIFRLLPRVAEKVFQNGKVDKLTWEWVSIINHIRTEDILQIGLVLGVAEKKSVSIRGRHFQSLLDGFF